MKQIFLLLFLLTGLCLNAQNPGTELAPCHFFDPERDPLALRSDSVLLLLVSEYVLAKSVKARLGQDCQVLKISKNCLPEGQNFLLFEGLFLAKNRQEFRLSIPLVPDTQGRFYYASSQALVCSAPGCNNCSIMNGKCVGCCSSVSGSAIAIPNPLLKVTTTIDE